MKHVVLSLALGLLASCMSLSDKSKELPEIKDEMKLAEAIELGVQYGDKTLEGTKNLIKKRNAAKEANDIAASLILDKNFEKEAMWRLVSLYQATTHKLVSPKVVEKLISSHEAFIRQLGWLLAANRPSDLVAAVLERHLTRSVVEGLEMEVLLPEMASAVKANHIADSYSLLANGLMLKGGVEFVDAMIALNPQKSRSDFMNYLALATVEDLRQMNQKTVDMQTCIAILRFLNEVGAPIEHPRFDHLFLYAVSRNPGFGELASNIIRKYMEGSRETLAYTLARLPVWIQIAFIEENRDNMNANLGLFFTELKQATAHKEVVEEIDAVKR